jgi:hypothetical protein
MRHVHVVIRCDHPKCPHSVSAGTQREALALARRTGWRLRNHRAATGDLCPEHNPQHALGATDD